jgi:hypothetical protein
MEWKADRPVCPLAEAGAVAPVDAAPAAPPQAARRSIEAPVAAIRTSRVGALTDLDCVICRLSARTSWFFRSDATLDPGKAATRSCCSGNCS